MSINNKIYLITKLEEIKKYFDDYIKENEDWLKESKYWKDDLHHHAFNEDYYIIGTYKAKQWLGSEVFDVIETIREYEQSNFGQVSTDFSDPEKVANMIAYILGEEILSESDIYQQIQFDKNILEEDDISNLIEDLKDSF